MSRYRILYGGLELLLDGFYLTGKLNEETMFEHSPLFEMYVEDAGTIDASTWETAICEGSTETGKLISVACHAERFRVRADLLEIGEGISFSLTAKAEWKEVPLFAQMCLPWLKELRLQNALTRYPANPVSRPDGSSAIQLHDAFALPICWIKTDRTGVAVRFDVQAGNLNWDNNRNLEMNRIAGERYIKEHRMTLRLNSTDTLICEALMKPIEHGWCEVFEDVRKRAWRNMDFSQYKRCDLKWVKDDYLQHFTYAYSAELVDYDHTENGETVVNVDRLIDDGADFGGYDSLILWHQYPRLGLDSRSQWDFFDDFPGGLTGLARVIQKAHERGVKVILPFKPWDKAPMDSDNDMTEKLCNVIRVTDADGIFFDTMNTVPLSFRQAIDATKPGVVFVTEGELQTRRSIEDITASWDQHWDAVPMPGCNLMRFLFPEHKRYLISRFSVGFQKDMEIERAIFQGSGMVIWQDVFGEWLPYSAEQKQKIRQNKEIIREYTDCFNSEKCVPLIQTLKKDVYANCFVGNARMIITLYNAGKNQVTGALIDFADTPLQGYQEVYECRYGQAFKISEDRVYGKIDPQQCVVAVCHNSRLIDS